MEVKGIEGEQKRGKGEGGGQNGEERGEGGREKEAMLG